LVDEVNFLMSAKRRDDTRVPNVFRTDRMVQEGGMWFFYTREGTLEGPFDGQLEATIQLDKYIKVVNSGLLLEREIGFQDGIRRQSEVKEDSLAAELSVRRFIR
jgi:hypothetical protein